ISGITKTVNIFDSLKILPMSIDSMPKSFDIPIKKLELDYHEDREVGHELTEEEQKYITNDVLILAHALNFMYSQNMKKLTTGSNALNYFKKQIGKEKYAKLF